MDKNEMNETLNELSGQIIATGRAVGSERTSHDLGLLINSLRRHADELQSCVRVLQAQGK